jgi:hypothetical protein
MVSETFVDIPSLPGSFRALRSCFPMHVRYSVLSDCSFSPNWSCGNFVVMFGVLFGSLHMAFWRAMIYWSSLVIFGMEYVWHRSYKQSLV